jgi:hypothetical protein
MEESSMTKRRALILQVVFVLLICVSAEICTQEAPSRQEYLQYARAAADSTWDRLDELVAAWREDFDPEFVFGYRPPGGLLETAVIYTYLFENEGNQEYAERAAKIVLSYGDYRSQYPEAAVKRRADYAEGVPTLPDFFTAMRYIRAYDTLHRLGRLSETEIEKIEGEIAHSMDYLLRTAEWGTMNRTTLRAETLAWAVRALPDHPRSGVWEMQRRALGDDNWGNWEIEDATIYHGVWLYSLLGYADCLGRLDEFFRTPETYYYAHYFLNLICPAGMVPDFGDANWMSNWAHYLVFFEAAAAQYKDPHLKWAASTIARKFVDFAGRPNIGLGYFFLDCYRWGTDDIAPEAPTELSQEVMEDVQGKKIVFRNGWQPTSTYLLLNYRDEGDGGLNFRDYLRDTIPVEEEKMTHGHADENSIVLLMAGGSVLLHDSGYRDFMPSGLFGAYRQDYFHNRLCVRQEKIFTGQNQGEYRYSTRDAVPGQSVLDFLRNAGSYRMVRTQKVDFVTLPDFDYSRTRLIDQNLGYEWDRVIAYVKDPELFVVFDVFKSRIEEYFTLANLWHTQKIVARGEHWYDTAVETIGQETLPDNKRLLLLFPKTHFRLEGTEPQKRHYQDEIAIHQTTAHHFELGGTDGFVTVLIPHGKGESPESWVEKVHYLEGNPDGAGLAVTIETEKGLITVAVKCDLRMDISRDWRRPRYTYDAGKIRFGRIESNGDFLFAREHGGRLDYTIVNLTKALYGDRLLFEVKPSVHGLAYDASPDGPGLGKVRYWRESVEIGEEKR